MEAIITQEAEEIWFKNETIVCMIH